MRKIIQSLLFLLIATYSSLAWALDAPVITATAKGPNQINLTWSEVANPGWGYRVEIQSNGDARYANWTELPITVNGRNYLPYWVTEGHYLDPTDATSGNGTPAQFPVFGLRNNTTYNFRVRSYAKTDNSIDTYSTYSSTASAATRNYNIYYVSTTGTDSITCGTLSSPCRHIYYAVNNRNLAQPGNVIYVRGGNYASDYLIPSNSGSYGIDTKVVIQAYPGEVVTITSHGGASWDPNIYLDGKQYVVIDGINTTAEVNGANTATVAITANSFRNAIVNVEIGYSGWPFIVYGSYNLIHRVYSHDAGSASGDGSDHMAIIFYDTLADRNVIQYSNFRRGEHDTGLFKNGADYNKFLNNLCDGGWGHGFATVSDGGAVTSYNLFEGNVVKDVATNYTTDVYKVGIQMSGSYNTVRRNEVYDNDGSGVEKSHGIGIVSLNGYSAANNLIYNNVFYHNGGFGIALFGPNESNNVIANNIIYYNSEPVTQVCNDATILLVDNYTGTTVYNNLILFRDNNGEDPNHAIITKDWDTTCRTVAYANQNYSEFSNNVTYTPSFVDEPSREFHLRSISQLIDAGQVVTDTTWGTITYRGTAPDLGAYEGDGGPPVPVLQFSSATYDVSEAGTTATITVTRTASSAGAVSVGYATSNGTATTAGNDYTATSGTLNWTDGDTAAQTFTITIINDTVVESNETVNITLSNPTNGAVLGTPNQVVLTITDNDSTGGGGSGSGGDSGGGSGGGCGFVNDDGKGQGAKGEGLSMIMLFLLLFLFKLRKIRHGRLFMRKSIGIFLLGLFLLLSPTISFAAVNLPWSTTYNCADWTQSNGLYNVNCDGMTGDGGWTCDNGDGTVREEQITALANFPGGAGGKGQRHWKGDGTNNTSGGLKIEFTLPQPELWVRWYLHYEQGLEWNPLNNDKILYIDVNTSQFLVFGHFWSDETGFVANGNPFLSGTGNGWNTIMANGATDARGNKTSDGQWHLYEIHIKMDTNGADGVGEVWVDGVRRMSRSDINFGSQAGKTGWSHILIGSNNRYPTTTRCMYVDYDDIAISTTGPIGPVTGGGGSGGGNTPPPSSGGDSSASGGSGCGFVKDNGKGQGAKGEGLTFAIMLIITLAGIALVRRVRYLKSILFFIIFLFHFSIANAANYYVDQNNSQSSDSNAGTEVLPWKTIQKAADTMVAGDTVLIKEGIYSKNGTCNTGENVCAIAPKNSGTIGNPITFKAYPGHKVIIDQNFEYVGFLILAKDYITIDGLEIRRALTAGIWAKYLSYPKTVKGLIIQNNIIHEITGPFAGNIGAIRADSVEGAIIRNNSLYNISIEGGKENASGIHNYDLTDSIVENNEIWNAVNGIFYKRQFGDKGQITRYNYIHDVSIGIRFNTSPPSSGITYGAVNHTVYNNIIYKTNNGISMWECDDVISSNNKFYNNTIIDAPIGINMASGSGANIETTQMWNNIFYNTIDGGNQWETNLIRIDKTSYILLSNYNNFYESTQWQPISWNTQYYALSGYQSASGFDANSISADPLFVDKANQDFHLQSSSPAKGKGLGGVDMGAYATGNEVIGPTDGGTGGGGGNTPPPSSGSGGDSGGGSSGGSGCGFVKDDNGKGPRAKGEGLSFAIMLIIALTGIALVRKIANNKGSKGVEYIKRMIYLSLFFFVVFCIPVFANATDYYVAPNGNDSNPGTETQPWQHIDWATCAVSYGCPITTNNPNKLKAGDTLYIRGGTYLENKIQFANSGTSTAPIIIKAYPGEKPIIDGGFTTVSAEIIPVFDIGALSGQGSHYITLDGLTIRRGSRANIRISETMPATYITIKNCDLMDFVAYNNSAQIYVDTTSDNITIENNKMHGMQSYDLRASGVVIFKAGTLTIRNNEIYSTSNGIYYKHSIDDGKISVIENNFIHDTSDLGMLWSRSDGIIRNNIIYNVGIGIKVFDEASSCPDLESKNNQLSHNTIVDAATGIYLSRSVSCPGAVNTTVKDNLIYNFTNSDHRGFDIYSWYSGSDTSNTTFDHNLIYSSSFSSPIRVLNNYYTTSTAPLAGIANIQQAPIFKDYANKDFTLMPNSPGYKAASDGYDMGADTSLPPTPTPDGGGGGNTPPPSSSSGGDSGGGSSGGSGCGFVKNDGKGQKAKGEGLSLIIMLIITLTGISLARRSKIITVTKEGVLVMNIRKNSLILSVRQAGKIAAISFLLTIFWSASAYAQPNITSFSGSLTNKGALTITGSGFGTKTTGAPLIWDNFEWGNNGDKVAAAGMGWNQFHYPSDPDVTINTTQKYGQGTRSTYYVVDPPEGQQAPESEEFGYLYKGFGEQKEIYASYMVRWNKIGGSGGMIKLARILNQSLAFVYNTPPYMGVTWFVGDDWDSHYDNGSGQVEILTSNIPLATQTWHRVEMYLKLSEPGGASNGEYGYWLNYFKFNTPQTITRISGSTETVDTFMSPHSFVNAVGGFYEIWMDDVYVGNTRARVEIGNAPTWAASNHREIQIPSAWSDTSITITVNQGSFSNLNNAYLYVIDADGNVNTNGYLLSDGGGGGDTGGNTPPPSSSSGGDSGGGSGGSGCGFVKDDGKGQKAKGEGLSIILLFLLLILLRLRRHYEYFVQLY